MSETKWTPGPWRSGRKHPDCKVQYVDSGPFPDEVCTLYFNDDEQDANAHLIASAPDLYAALADLVARCDGDEGVRADSSNIQTMRAHAALASARGEEP